jgi:hypothetical protein
MSRFAVRSLVLALVATTAGCGAAPTSSSSGGSEGSKGSGTGAAGASSSGGSSSGPTKAAPTTVTEKGVIVDFNSKSPIVGATVTAGAQTVTTGDDGSFSFTLESGQAFALSVSAQGYATLLQQSTSLTADYDAGKITIVPTTLANILTGYFIGYDDTLGVLSLDLVPTGSCSTIQGATVTVSPAGGAKVAYFAGGIPSQDLTSAQAGQFPSAVLYNVEPNVQLTVSATVPGCTQMPFPVTQDGVDYTGGISTLPGQVTGFARIFLQ